MRCFVHMFFEAPIMQGLDLFTVRDGLDHNSDHHVTRATGRRASAPAPTLERGSQSARARPVVGLMIDAFATCANAPASCSPTPHADRSH